MDIETLEKLKELRGKSFAPTYLKKELKTTIPTLLREGFITRVNTTRPGKNRNIPIVKYRVIIASDFDIDAFLEAKKQERLAIARLGSQKSGWRRTYSLFFRPGEFPCREKKANP